MSSHHIILDGGEMIAQSKLSLSLGSYQAMFYDELHRCRPNIIIFSCFVASSFCLSLHKTTNNKELSTCSKSEQTNDDDKMKDTKAHSFAREMNVYEFVFNGKYRIVSFRV
jgi:hypothetical protein